MRYSLEYLIAKCNFAYYIYLFFLKNCFICLTVVSLAFLVDWILALAIEAVLYLKFNNEYIFNAFIFKTSCLTCHKLWSIFNTREPTGSQASTWLTHAWVHWLIYGQFYLLCRNPPWTLIVFHFVLSREIKACAPGNVLCLQPARQTWHEGIISYLKSETGPYFYPSAWHLPQRHRSMSPRFEELHWIQEQQCWTSNMLCSFERKMVIPNHLFIYTLFHMIISLSSLI